MDEFLTTDLLASLGGEDDLLHPTWNLDSMFWSPDALVRGRSRGGEKELPSAGRSRRHRCAPWLHTPRAAAARRPLEPAARPWRGVYRAQ